MEKFIHYAIERNVPTYSKTVTANSLAEGIIDEIKMDNNVRLLLLRMPRESAGRDLIKTTVQELFRENIVNIGVLYDKGLTRPQNILVPVGGGYHCKLAIQLAYKLASINNGQVDFLRVVPTSVDEEAYEDQMAYLQEVVMGELSSIPADASLHLDHSDSPAESIIHQANLGNADLIIIGSSELYEESELFGKIAEQVAAGAPCSTLIIRQHESPAASWLRRQVKSMEKKD